MPDCGVPTLHTPLLNDAFSTSPSGKLFLAVLAVASDGYRWLMSV